MGTTSLENVRMSAESEDDGQVLQVIATEAQAEEVRRLVACVERWKKKAQERGSKIVQLESELAAMKVEHAELVRQHELDELDITEFQAVIADHQAEERAAREFLREQENRKAAYDARLAQPEANLKHYIAEIARLRRDNEQKDARIEELEAKLEANRPPTPSMELHDGAAWTVAGGLALTTIGGSTLAYSAGAAGGVGAAISAGGAAAVFGAATGGIGIVVVVLGLGLWFLASRR